MVDVQRHYTALFDKLRDPVLLVNDRGAIVRANRAAHALFGILPGQATPDAPPEWLVDEIRQTVSRTPLASLEQRTVKTLEGNRHYEVEYEPVSDNPGEPGGALVILHDITDVKETEQEALFRSTFSQLISEMSARFIGIEPNAFDSAVERSLALLGAYACAADVFIVQFESGGERAALSHWWSSRGATPPRIAFEAVAPSRVRRWRSTLAESDIVAVSAPKARPDQIAHEPLLDCLGVACAIRVPLIYQDQAIGCMGFTAAEFDHAWGPEIVDLLRIAAQVFTNALQQRRFEEALAQERNLLRTLIDGLPDYIYVKDEGSRFVLNNVAHLRLLRASRQEEVYGKTDHDIFPNELADMYRRDELSVMTSGLPLVNREETVLTEEGERRWLLTTKVPLRGPDGEPTGILGLGRDITTRKRMAEELESHARLLEQANADLSLRNQELDEFTYIASHDLQEPLRKLIAFSDVLNEDLDAGDTAGVKRAAHTIASAARRMKTLVEDLLALSRSGRQSVHWEYVSLDECVDLALDVLEVRIAEEKAEIQRRPLPTVWGDRNLLVQLFQNLLGNALKFYGDAPPYITFTVEADGDDSIIGILDNGIGIRPEYAEQIFAPFKRLHGRGRYDGTGIGLAICRKIVERHEGRIWAEPAPGGGAHFRFVLRARREETPT